MQARRGKDGSGSAGCGKAGKDGCGRVWQGMAW